MKYFAALVFVSASLLADRAEAYVTYNRLGYVSCTACHFNATGGGLLIRFLMKRARAAIKAQQLAREAEELQRVLMQERRAPSDTQRLNDPLAEMASLHELKPAQLLDSLGRTHESMSQQDRMQNLLFNNLDPRQQMPNAFYGR